MDNGRIEIFKPAVLSEEASRPVHITRARARTRTRQDCARRETRLAFTCARKSSSTLLQLLAFDVPTTSGAYCLSCDLSYRPHYSRA
jgi:hypothetical protein